MVEIVTLAGRRLHLLLLEGRVIKVAGGARPDHDVTVERLAITRSVERLDSDTLWIGAFGLNRLIQFVASIPSYQTVKAFGQRMDEILVGDAFAPEMRRATVQAKLGLPATGETAYWKRIAERQLAWRPDPAGPFEIETVMR